MNKKYIVIMDIYYGGREEVKKFKRKKKAKAYAKKKNNTIDRYTFFSVKNNKDG